MKHRRYFSFQKRAVLYDPFDFHIFKFSTFVWKLKKILRKRIELLVFKLKKHMEHILHQSYLF